MYISIHGRIRRSGPSCNMPHCRVRALHGIPRLLAAAMLFVLPLVAQSPGAPGSPPHMQNRSSEFPFDNPSSMDQLSARRIAMLNSLRQKAIMSDADKLLLLARELNDDATAGGTILSLPEKMHKAAEIEKLAKNVKEKMTYSIGDPTQLGPTQFFPH